MGNFRHQCLKDYAAQSLQQVSMQQPQRQITQILRPALPASVQQGRAPAQQARAYAMLPSAVGNQGVQGTLKLYGTVTKALFDTGFTHSFISQHFACELDLVSELLEILMSVYLPLSGIIFWREICRDCSIIICDYCFPADLIVLTYKGFGLILGFNWLREHLVLVDCATRTLHFYLPGRDPLFMCCDVDEPVLTYSFLASLDGTKPAVDIISILVVCDFSDVFHDILGLPP